MRPISWSSALRGLIGVTSLWLILMIILQRVYPELFAPQNRLLQIASGPPIPRILLACTLFLIIVSACMPAAWLYAEYRLARVESKGTLPRMVWTDAILYFFFLVFLVVYLQKW